MIWSASGFGCMSRIIVARACLANIEFCPTDKGLKGRFAF